MNAPALAEAAVDLPWLAPAAGSLVALVRLPSKNLWEQVRADPGMVLLLARHGNQQGPTFFGSACQNPLILENALRLLEQPLFADWNDPQRRPIYETCLRQAQWAHALAGKLELAPECAWLGGLLAPLGWLAAGAIDPAAVERCRRHPDFPHRPALVQQQTWGLDHTAIARRLCRRWDLPPWLATIPGHLGLPAGIAESLGADRRLFQVVQLAVSLVQEEGHGLGLAVGGTPSALLADLGLDRAAVTELREQIAGQEVPAIACWQPPQSLPLLPDYLRLACESRRGRLNTLVERWQGDVDRLHQALEEQCAGEKKRLRDLKLGSLAELAAGAGHEINNPLAVISGQAQYLLGRENDLDRCKSLNVIIGQARRIHQILNDLMQYARPAPPRKQPVEVAGLLQEVAASLRELAEKHQVRLLCPEPATVTGRVLADPSQVRLILGNMLRNAIEAAPVDGWAGIRALENGPNLDFVVEDSGPGPSLADREHLFDPFYSGRSAGRGRGLGLATAWRLAQQNAGNIRCDDRAQGPTRFILSLPAAPAETPERFDLTPPLANGKNGCVAAPVLS